MLLDINRFFQGKENDIDTELSVSLQNEDFFGARIEQPVKAKFKARFDGGSLLISLTASAVLEAECARCLAPLTQELTIERSFSFKKDELLCEEPEISVTEDFKLNVKELIYTELVLEVPTVLLCSENCEGLCHICGAKKGNCSCKAPRVVDERLAVLEKLLS